MDGTSDNDNDNATDGNNDDPANDDTTATIALVLTLEWLFDQSKTYQLDDQPVSVPLIHQIIPYHQMNSNLALSPPILSPSVTFLL